MVEVRHEGDAPPVPGFWRLGWLLFMQPLTLHRLFADWGLEKDPSLWKLRGRLKTRDPVVLTLVARLGGWLLLITPVSTVVVAGSLDLAGLPVRWNDVPAGIAICTALGIAIGFIYGISVGVVFGIVMGVCAVAGASVAAGYNRGVARGVAVGLSIDVGICGLMNTVGIKFGNTFYRIIRIPSVVAGIVVGIAIGLFLIYTGDPSAGIAAGVAVGVVPLFTLRLPFYLTELMLTAALRLACFRLASIPHLASYLPHRHDELIYLPLPFLAGILIRLGEEDPAEGRRAINEAAASLGQKGPARRALVELQARSLERAARERRYASTAALALPFLPERESLEVKDRDQHSYLVIADSIAAAAQDLEAARSTGIHHQRRQALTRARKELERTLDRLTTIPRLTRDERRFLPVVKAWLDRVEDEEAALMALEQEQPQVPLVFVAGVPLTPADKSLFVGREDLGRLLDQDLAAERPVPLVLLGQRRMGKSTLLNFLPRLLGTGTRVVRLDFQGLSGHPLRGKPHRWVATEVQAALAGETASRPPEETSWSATLDWLAALEEPLTASDRRLLIALDEVEGLERGIREKWSDPAFLDFLRAAGDRLRRIRFLLVTAHPFSRLGPHWSDRLISAQTRRIEQLAEGEARTLLTEPVAGFPNIYPPGGVERLLTETACHPYLLQLTAYLLTRRLNEGSRLKATDDDITAALDQALEENNLFQNLWDDLTATEQRLLAVLARGDEVEEAASETLSQARRDLAREQLIQRGGNGEGWRVAVPLFARWIREIGAAG